MNRLWVRISLVIAGVAIFIALFPLAYRQVTNQGLRGGPPPWREDIPAELIPEERIAQWETRVQDRTWWLLWSSVAVGAVIGLGAGIWLSRGLVKPLLELEKGAQAIAARDLSYRVPEAGSREVRAVGHSFNQMATHLEHQETLRRNMLADVTHELRHPVHLLGGNLRGILDGVFPLEMGEIAFLAEQTQHLTQLVNDLHELALAEADELPLHRQEAELSEVIQHAVDAVEPLLLEKEILLQWQRPSFPITRHIDTARMRQVIQNLLGNAIRYTPSQGVIGIELTTVGDEAHMAIHDNGMGIDPADLPRVFDRFYRSDTSRNREEGGAGLGLAIAKAIVFAHNGHIRATSAGSGQGSTFTVILPAHA